MFPTVRCAFVYLSLQRILRKLKLSFSQSLIKDFQSFPSTTYFWSNAVLLHQAEEESLLIQSMSKVQTNFWKHSAHCYLCTFIRREHVTLNIAMRLEFGGFSNEELVQTVCRIQLRQ